VHNLSVRVGIAKFDDGWNVIVDLGGKVSVYEPTFATEAEAEAKALEAIEALGRRAVTSTEGSE